VRFFPVLPLFYSTYWWGGVPYYYWDDAYYTWDADENGYVATDPPPAVEGADSSSDSGSAAIYAYPRNGQTAEQLSTDRYQCHQWAVGETGFDPTSGAAPSAASSPADYRRAMIACMDGKGYSTQ
jgi:hypothetical protein